ncbi:class I SAM-dependent methyltransferase [Baekduia sp. Peel2402]|uniref:class I SAM-dependent methyltransferase n=1 Tax=Baekduia sp. Peel2402 TaxID=3458296 RepID=UPI00403ECC10
MRDTPAGDFDYEANGSGYAVRRQPDPRIAAFLHAALGDARTVINVGAGAGSYEPEDRHVVAVEPSATMRAQRPHHLAPALDATAERLPFDEDSFDAAMATITIHQWNDLDAGLRELRRVTRGPIAILTFDGDALQRFWLNEYVPEVIATERVRFPAIDHVVGVLGGAVEVLDVPIPIDCTDGFGEAYYARPEAFLAEDVRAAQSGWVLTDPAAVARGVAHLADDLASGAWDERHGHLRTQPEHIGAVRLVVARQYVGPEPCGGQ